MPTGSDCLEPVELEPKIGLGSVCGTTTACAREGANNLVKRKDSLCMLSSQSLARPTCRGYEGKVGSLSSWTLNMHDVCFYLIGPEILIELAFTGWHLTGERERQSERERCLWSHGWLWYGYCVSELLLCQLTCLCVVLSVLVAGCTHTGCRGWLAYANDMAPVVVDDGFLLCIHAAGNMIDVLLYR